MDKSVIVVVAEDSVFSFSKRKAVIEICTFKKKPFPNVLANIRPNFIKLYVNSDIEVVERLSLRKKARIEES